MNKHIFKRQVKRSYKSEQPHILQSPGVREFFVLCCIAADAFTLYSVFDLLLTERQDMVLVITGTVAGAMNIIPVLLAACLYNEYLSGTMRKVLSCMLLTLFVLLFTVTFGLRYSSRTLLFQSASDLGSFVEDVSLEDDEVLNGNIEENEEETTVAQDILAVILGVEPLATSIIAFYLSYEASPYRRRKYLRELEKIELRAEIANVKIMVRELEKDIAFDQKAYDAQRLRVMKDWIIYTAEEDEYKARRILAETEGTSEAVEYLIERDWKHKKDEGMGAALPDKSVKGTGTSLKMVSDNLTA